MNNKIISTYFILIIITLFALYLIKVFNISYPLTIKTSTVSTELAVVGEGKVDVVPDTAQVDVGIQATNEVTVEAVESKINNVNNAIVEAMKRLGVKQENIKTSNYSITPDYTYDEATSERRITGYNGNATITVKTKETDLTAKIITASTEAGANQIHGVRFTTDEPQKYRSQAREKAIENAKEEAKKLAKSLAIKLGKVVNIVESSPDIPPPVFRAAEAQLGGGEPIIEPGSQTITSTVTLYFEKK